jgi:competence protein ComGF
MYSHSLKMSSESGYTFVNAVLQMSIFLLFSQIFLLTVHYIYQTEDRLTNVTDMEWAIFVQQVDSYLVKVDSIILQEEPAGIRYTVNQEEYDIEYYPNMVRKQKNKVGHEPLLMNVENLAVSMSERSLTFQVRFKNGSEKEHTIYVTEAEQ